jgi:hypothetical protein
MHQSKARDETGRKVRFYMALGLVAAATLMAAVGPSAYGSRIKASRP